MTKELELSKKLAVLGWILRKGLNTEDEYNRTSLILYRRIVGGLYPIKSEGKVTQSVIMFFLDNLPENEYNLHNC